MQLPRSRVLLGSEKPRAGFGNTSRFFAVALRSDCIIRRSSAASSGPPVYDTHMSHFQRDIKSGRILHGCPPNCDAWGRSKT
jgi:hypothetical protein